MRPTLAELRSRVHKQRHREIGNWLARRVGRPSAVYGTWAAVRLGLTANQVTTAALFATIGAAIAFGVGGSTGFVVGAILTHLAFWLDHVDGQVARWNRTASLDGVFYDYMLHHVWTLAIGFGLGHGLAVERREPLWSVAGFALGAGWTLIGLTNDARYKAFVQRLKSDARTFVVKGGAGGRPAPPSPWPRRGAGMITWPLYKSCEPHVVLIGLTLVASVAVLRPATAGELRAWSVLGLSIVAPILAAARVARSLGRGSVEAEFARWFVPIEAVESVSALDSEPARR